ncbi:MAG TPA: hypothetical protein VFG72_06565 [Marmoricola sp.]|nr:hypothetical protein [Marmoricola sp.]
MTDHDRLTDTLRGRAASLGDQHPLSLDDVKGRATGIRRRRRVVSGLAAAAVLAVAVPAGIAVSDRTASTTRPDSGPVATADGTPDPRPVVPADPVPLDVDTAARSGEAGIPVLYDGLAHLPEGGTFELPGDYTDMVRTADGWAGVVGGIDGTGRLDLLDESGDVLDTAEATRGLAVSPDGTVLAYVTPDGEVVVVTGGEAEVLGALPEGQFTPAGVVGCADGGCTVFTNTESGPASLVTADGVEPAYDFLEVTGVTADGRVAGVISVEDDPTKEPGSCSAVVDDAGEQLWETCEFTLGRFSPDGEMVLGHPAYQSGEGDGSLAVLDADDGTVLAEYVNNAESQAFLYTSAWDADGTVLGLVRQGMSWHLMRFTADGQLSHATSGGEGEWEYVDGADAPLRFVPGP